MQSQTVPAYFDEPTKTVKHELTLLEGLNECNCQGCVAWIGLDYLP
jgi:hypothetical protein